MVKSLDRVNGVANVLPYGQTTSVPARYQSHRGRPNCWPLGNCYIEQLASGQWQVNGGVGHRRVILHDDFLHVDSHVGLGAGATGATNGDTPWRYGNSLPSGTIQQGGQDAGTLELTGTNAGAAFPLLSVVKDVLACAIPTGTAGLHFTARFMFTNANPANAYYALGLSETNNVAGIVVSGGFKVTAQNAGGGTQSLVQATTPVANTWYYCDVFWTAHFVAGLIGGDGPYVTTGSLATTAVEPDFDFSVANGAAAALYVDFVELAYLGTVLNPSVVPGMGS